MLFPGAKSVILTGPIYHADALCTHSALTLTSVYDSVGTGGNRDIQISGASHQQQSFVLRGQAIIRQYGGNRTGPTFV